MLTKAVASNVLINGLRWWTDDTENEYDDRVVDAMSAALGIDSKSVKMLQREQSQK